MIRALKCESRCKIYNIPSRGTSKILVSFDQAFMTACSSFDNTLTFSLSMGNIESSTWQTVPLSGSLPSLKYSLIALAEQSDFAAKVQCYRKWSVGYMRCSRQ